MRLAIYLSTYLHLSRGLRPTPNPNPNPQGLRQAARGHWPLRGRITHAQDGRAHTLTRTLIPTLTLILTPSPNPYPDQVALTFAMSQSEEFANVQVCTRRIPTVY
eukprot:scaffold14031_cov69-Phaeocystis_antarctica.AAC.1